MKIHLTLFASLLAACTFAGAAETADATLPARAMSPGSVAAMQPAPPPLDAAGEGRRQYLKLNCYGCHGMAAAGGMGPSIVHAESGDVREAVMQGQEGGMPSFRNYVTSTDISNLTTYLQSIGSANEPTFMDWWKKIPKK